MDLEAPHLEAPDLEAVGGRIEQILDDLSIAIIPREYERVTEVVRLVTELYGAALERIVARIDPATFLDDELIASLLIVHDLHPSGLRARVEGALAAVRPMLANHEGDVELLDVDAEAGAVRLRLLGSCDGCPSSSATLQNAVQRAIHEAAPDVVIIDIANGEETPITLGRKPIYDECPTEVMAQ